MICDSPSEYKRKNKPLGGIFLLLYSFGGIGKTQTFLKSDEDWNPLRLKWTNSWKIKYCNFTISLGRNQDESKTVLSSDILAISVSLKVEILLQYLFCPPLCCTSIFINLANRNLKPCHISDLSFYPNRATNINILFGR